MKKWFLGIILAIGLISMRIATPTFAAEESPFNGTFTGTAYGDYKSSAPLTVDVAQDGSSVKATLDIGRGLKVNAGGFCGSIVIPAGVISADGVDTDDSPNGLKTRVPFEIGNGTSVTAEITGEMSTNGDLMDVEVKVKTPFICGNNPVITGSLTTQ